MSAGRRRVSLDDLQGVAGDGYSTAVRKMLLGEDAPTGPGAAPELVAVPLLSADAPREAYTKPADWAHRTTRAEVRAEVKRRAVKRLPLGMVPLVNKMLYGDALKGVTYTRPEIDTCARVLREVYRDFMAEVPPRPVRKVKTERMPTRMHGRGENSRVVVRVKTGEVFVGDRMVTEAEADLARREIGVQ